MSDDKTNDLSRFVSQPGEMELLTPEAILDRLDRMASEALSRAGEQDALIAKCDDEIAYFDRLEAELDDEIVRLERELADSERQMESYGNQT